MRKTYTDISHNYNVGRYLCDLDIYRPSISRYLDVVLTVPVPRLRHGLVDQQVLDPGVALQLPRLVGQLLADPVNVGRDFLVMRYFLML